MTTESLPCGPSVPLVEYERSRDEAMSEAVLASLERAGVDLFDTGTVLHDAIDPDALDTLFGTPPAGDVTLSFRIWRFTVHLQPETVWVYPAGTVPDLTVDTRT